MGLEFPGEAVIALGGTPIHEPLLELKSKRFVRERGIDEWAFVHVLIRDAAYEGMLKRTRATLHERFADWLDARDRSAELTEIVAYHLEQAYLLGLELGAVDEHLADVGRRAASLLERSALRARDRTLAAITSSLFERAARCADGEERADLLSRALEAATGAQELGRAKAILRELRSGELPMSESSRARVRLAELDVEAAGAHADRAAEAAAVAESARGRGDDEVLSGALRLVARYSAWSGGLRYARQASTESVGAARRSGRRDHEVEALAHVAGTSIFDGDPIDRSVETCLAALAERPDDRTLELALVRPLTVLLHMQGRLDEADRALERYRQLVDELGPTFLRINMISEAESMRAGIERDPIAMERAIRPAYERLAAAGEKELLSSYSATLAHALVGQGRLDEAMTLSEESEQISAEDDYDAQTRWRSARALVWAAQGRFEEAERLMGEALTIAAGTEDISLHGDTLLDRAMLLRSAGRESEANASIEEAAARFERKGNVRAAQVARLHLEQGS
jgi:tetratricopeptide (TPR) repeat protein